MASTRPPTVYSPSARTGRRGGGSGGVAGMVRRAGSDTLPALRSTDSVGGSAARRRNRPSTAFESRDCLDMPCHPPARRTPTVRAAQPARKQRPPMGVMAPSQRVPVTAST